MRLRGQRSQSQACGPLHCQQAAGWGWLVAYGFPCFQACKRLPASQLDSGLAHASFGASVLLRHLFGLSHELVLLFGSRRSRPSCRRRGGEFALLTIGAPCGDCELSLARPRLLVRIVVCFEWVASARGRRRRRWRRQTHTEQRARTC